MYAVIAAVAVAIAVTGYLFSQSFFRILPLFVSLFVLYLQTKVSRLAPLLGGCNSILYGIVFFSLGMYTSAVTAVAVNSVLQFLTFLNWNRKKDGASVKLGSMTKKQNILLILGSVLLFALLVGGFAFARNREWLAPAENAGLDVIDRAITVVSNVTTVLTLLAYREYSYWGIPNGILSIVSGVFMTVADPAQITYLIYYVYSFFCILLTFRRVRILYRAQQEAGASPSEAKAVQ